MILAGPRDANGAGVAMVDDFIALRNFERGWIGGRKRNVRKPQSLIAIARIVTLDLQVDSELR